MLNQAGPILRDELSKVQNIGELAGQQFCRRRAGHYRESQAKPETTTSHRNEKGKYWFGVNKQIYSMHDM